MHNRRALAGSDYNAAGGFRSTSSYGYLEQRSRRGTLTVETGARVLSVEFDRDVAVGVSYVDRDGKLARSEAEGEIVLCAGALATPKLLMLSGVGPADSLREVGIEPVVDLPAGWGKPARLMWSWIYSGVCPRPVTNASLLKPQNIAWAGLRWLFLKSGPAAVGQCHTGAYVRSNNWVRTAQLRADVVSGRIRRVGAAKRHSCIQTDGDVIPAKEPGLLAVGERRSAGRANGRSQLSPLGRGCHRADGSLRAAPRPRSPAIHVALCRRCVGSGIHAHGKG